MIDGGVTVFHSILWWTWLPKSLECLIDNVSLLFEVLYFGNKYSTSAEISEIFDNEKIIVEVLAWKNSSSTGNHDNIK